MPRGSRHDETSTIGSKHNHLLLLRDDGLWRFDAPLAAAEYVGRRMRVVGVRFGFVAG